MPTWKYHHIIHTSLLCIPCFYFFNKFLPSSPADAACWLRQRKLLMRGLRRKQHGGVLTAPHTCREVSPSKAFTEAKFSRQGKRNMRGTRFYFKSFFNSLLTIICLKTCLYCLSGSLFANSSSYLIAATCSAIPRSVPSVTFKTLPVWYNQ